MPTTFTEVLPATKSSKGSAMNWTPNESGEFSPVAGVLTVHTDRASVKYAVTEFPTPWPGRAFGLAKLTDGTDGTAESYAVFCGRHGPAGDACDCKGFTRWAACKHTSACRALLANGWV